MSSVRTICDCKSGSLLLCLTHPCGEILRTGTPFSLFTLAFYSHFLHISPTSSKKDGPRTRIRMRRNKLPGINTINKIPRLKLKRWRSGSRCKRRRPNTMVTSRMEAGMDNKEDAIKAATAEAVAAMVAEDMEVMEVVASVLNLVQHSGSET